MITSFSKYVKKRDIQEANVRYFRPGIEELEPRILPTGGVVPQHLQQHMAAMPSHIAMSHQATMPTDTHGAQQITMPHMATSQSPHASLAPHAAAGQDSAGLPSHLFGLGLDPKLLATMMQHHGQTAGQTGQQHGTATPASLAHAVTGAAQHAAASLGNDVHADKGDPDEGEVAAKLQEAMKKEMEGAEVEVREGEHGELHVELPDVGEEGQEMHERLEKAKEKAAEILERLGKLVEKVESTGENSFAMFLKADDNGDMDARDALFATLARESRDYLALAGIRPQKRRKKKRRR